MSIDRTQRRLPKWEKVKPLLGLQMPSISQAAKVAKAASIPDLRRIALRRAPRAVFDYVDGAAETETSLWRARQAFRQVEFQPAVLRDVKNVDLTRTILGQRSSMPFVMAPTGFTRMMHAEGEPAVVRAAHAAGVAYTLSTMGTTSPEDVAAAEPDARRWFQLYVWQERDKTEALLERARRSRFEAVMLTVDTPVGGARLRDVRNGLTIPPKLTLKTLLDMSMHPRWWMDVLTTAPLEFASATSLEGTVQDIINSMFDPSLTFADLAWLRERWDGPIVVKGVQTVADAKECVAHGADAIVISNHGGRQLDRAPTPLLVLPDIAAAVGEQVEVYLDGGVLSGADIVAAIAAGANAVLVGRAYLYGLMAAGREGVDRTLAILRTEITRTMQLLGVSRVDDLSPGHVTLPAASALH